MGMHFVLKANGVKADHFLVHPDTALNLGLSKQVKVVLHFGMRSHSAIMKFSEEIGKKELVISQNLIKRLVIPAFCRYELIVKGNEVTIGPYIGILMEDSRVSRLSDPRYPPFMRYVHRYDLIGGAVIAFTLSGINGEQATISGYMYNPEDRRWHKGVFSYPASIFKRIRIPDKMDQFLKGVIGGKRIFNSPNLNKWEMHKLLSSFPELRQHVPDSTLYESPVGLDLFLNIHPQIYVKPIHGSDGVGIIKLCKQHEGFMAMYRTKRENGHHLFRTSTEFHQFLMGGNKKRFMLQKELKLISFDDRLIDFRLNLVKNQAGEWNGIGLFARYGASGSIISNMSAGGRAKYAAKALREMLNMSNTEAKSYINRMHVIGMKVVQNLESNAGLYANVGVDFGMDTDGKIWIIEVNTVDPGFSFFESEGKLNNMLYAKRLAGFADQ